MSIARMERLARKEEQKNLQTVKEDLLKMN
jgi:hypothetical protein